MGAKEHLLLEFPRERIIFKLTWPQDFPTGPRCETQDDFWLAAEELGSGGVINTSLGNREKLSLID